MENEFKGSTLSCEEKAQGNPELRVKALCPPQDGRIPQTEASNAMDLNGTRVPGDSQLDEAKALVLLRSFVLHQEALPNRAHHSEGFLQLQHPKSMPSLEVTE